jgi:hypothetical protein
VAVAHAPATGCCPAEHLCVYPPSAAVAAGRLATAAAVGAAREAARDPRGGTRVPAAAATAGAAP